MVGSVHEQFWGEGGTRSLRERGRHTECAYYGRLRGDVEVQHGLKTISVGQLCRRDAGEFCRFGTRPGAIRLPYPETRVVAGWWGRRPGLNGRQQPAGVGFTFFRSIASLGRDDNESLRVVCDLHRHDDIFESAVSKYFGACWVIDSQD